MRLWIAFGLAATVLVAAAAAVYVQWTGQGQVEIPGTAYVALALGVVFTLLLGCGLMALVFFSSRRGYDERAERGIGRDHPAPR